MTILNLTECDRCGKVGEVPTFSGITSFYYGNVKKYVYYGQERTPDHQKIDLCHKCQGELDAFVSTFMEQARTIA